MKIDTNEILLNLDHTDYRLGGVSVILIWIMSLLERTAFGTVDLTIFGWNGLIIFICGFAYLEYRVNKACKKEAEG